MTTPGPAGMPIAVPRTTKTQVHTMNDMIEIILALSTPSCTLRSSHRIAPQITMNANT